MRRPAPRACPPLLSALLALAAAGCAQSVAVRADFPEPLVEPLPLRIGLRYTPAFVEYSYAEDLPGDVRWTFDIGPGNRRLFDRVMASMFDGVVPLEADASPPAGLDAIIEPEVKALEFSLPRQSRSDQYMVWIRYNLRVIAPDGSLIANWPISAYGQSDSRVMKGSRSMEMATVRAMRDAAATIVTGFTEDPDIRKALLEEPDDADD